jgi:hypothetical protein
MTHELPGSEEALMKRVCGKSGKDLDGTVPLNIKRPQNKA